MYRCVWSLLRRRPKPTRTLDLLPTELLLEIVSYLATRVPDLASVAVTNRRLHFLVTPLLHTAALGTRDRYGRSIIRRAVGRGDIVLLQRLLLYGNRCGLDEREPGTGTTALHTALMLGRREAVTVLLCNGASVDVPDRKGWSAVHWAVLSGNYETTEEVLDYGAAPGRGTKDRGRSGTTPLHMAAALGDAEMAGLLIRRGANTQAKDEYGMRAVDYAAVVSLEEGGVAGVDGGKLKRMLAVDDDVRLSVADHDWWLTWQKRMMIRRWRSVVSGEEWLARRK